MRTRAECNDARVLVRAFGNVHWKAAKFPGKPESVKVDQKSTDELTSGSETSKRSIGVKKRVRSRCHGVFQQLRTFFDSTEEEIRTFPALCKHSSRWRPERVSTFRLCVSQRATLAF